MKIEVVICQSCGAMADEQSDVVLNGKDGLYSCPVCKQGWMEVSENSLPLQIEKHTEKEILVLRKKTKALVAEAKRIDKEAKETSEDE